jgi:hypothetical protein
MNQKIHPIPENLAAAAHIKRTDYQRTYAESVEDPDRFWACIGHRIDWIEEFSVVKDASYAEGGFRICWLSDGKLDVERGDRVTIYLPMIPGDGHCEAAVRRIGIGPEEVNCACRGEIRTRIPAA